MAKNKKSYYIVGIVTDNPKAWEINCKLDGAKAINFQLETNGRLTKRDEMFINSHLDAIAKNPVVKVGTA